MKSNELSQMAIARIAHNLHVSFFRELDIPCVVDFADLDMKHKATMCDSIYRIEANIITSAAQSHDNFVKLKRSQGWTYAPAYNREDKKSPRICNWGELESVYVVAELLFFNCVKSLSMLNDIHHQ